MTEIKNIDFIELNESELITAVIKQIKKLRSEINQLRKDIK